MQFINFIELFLKNWLIFFFLAGNKNWEFVDQKTVEVVQLNE